MATRLKFLQRFKSAITDFVKTRKFTDRPGHPTKSTTIKKWVSVAWFGYSWLAGAPPSPTPTPTPTPFSLRAPAEVSGWWGMVNIMEPGKPHRLDAKIPHWWSLRNVRSHEQSVPKLWAKTNLTGPLLPQQKETMEVPQNRRLCFDVYSSSPWAHLSIYTYINSLSGCVRGWAFRLRRKCMSEPVVRPTQKFRILIRRQNCRVRWTGVVNL
jgi:hypothetical protein